MQDLIPEVTIPEFPHLIKETYDIDPKINVYGEGPPGIGKTDGVYQAAELIAKDYGHCEVGIFILSQMESSDFSIPWVYPLEKGGVTYRKVPLADFIITDNKPRILFFDETPNGSLDVQKAFQNIASSREIGGVKLPASVMIVGAGNRKVDRAGANGLLSALSNRFCYVSLSADTQGWLDKWSVKNNIDWRVRYYIRENPQSLFDFDPKREINATPRQWAKISKIVRASPKHSFALIAGHVGTQKAIHFQSALNLMNELPTRQEILADPTHAKLPKKADWMVPLSFAMIDWMDDKNRDALCTYLLRMGLEHQSMVFKSLKEFKIDLLMGNKEFVKWAKENQDLIVGG